MEKATLLFEYSPWFIIFCLGLGAGYAYLLYQKEGPWGKSLNYVLAGTRFVLASLLAFLLIGPFLRQIKNTVENPTYIFAIDNSASMAATTDSTLLQNLVNNINTIKNEVADQNYAAEIRTFSSTTSNSASLNFDHPSTDLNGLLKNIQEEFEGRTVAGLVLLSDGIYNQGVSPNFTPYKFPIHTIAVGDTVPKSDVNINAIYYNKIAYQGNQFPILAEITSNGLADKTIDIQVIQNGRILKSQQLTLRNNNTLDEIEFLIDADVKGLQHYQITVQPLAEEFTIKNNRKDAYVDVIEGKEKILLVARAPHPDIKMIRNSITKNDNYDFEVFIPGMSAMKEDQYDLVIFHQLPDRMRTAQREMEDLLAKGVATWFIVGSMTDLNYFNRVNGVLEVNSNRFQTDRVIPSFNPNFQRFIFEEESQRKIDDFSPITVPYGEVNMAPNAQTVLYQRVGSIVTKKPLLAINQDGDEKRAALLGEGLWQWRLQEYLNNQDQAAFDELVSKMVQYLSAKEDKRKFKVYPINNEIFDTENIVFETEIYNNIYERIYDKDINLSITSETGEVKQYAYAISQNSSRYTVTGFPQGIYRYTATTQLDGETIASSGEFSVKSLQIEDINLTANFQLLRSLSVQNGGNFYLAEQIDELRNELITSEVQGTIHSNEAYLPIINMSWVFFLLVGLVSLEWFTRKYNGGY